MTQIRRVLVIGTGLAGASAASALRERGFDGSVTMIGSQPHRPYELPALSKGILLGDTEDPDWVHDDGFYAEHDIDLIASTTITRLHLGDRVAVDGQDTRHGYDRLILATGSAPRTMNVPGADLRTLRTLDDSRALRSVLTDGARLVIVGAGWIGCEVAAAARKHGAEVTVIDPLPLPLHRTLGDAMGAVFRDLHAEHGVIWKLGTGVAGFTGEDAVTGVRLSDGAEIPADVVLVAVGAAPRVDLAHAAGLELADGGGLAVDAVLRSSAPDVYAAGDIAAHFHPRYGRRVRVEHWANAKDQGAHVAGSVLGSTDPYLSAPYFFSDQYDLGMEVRGLANPVTDDLVIRGDLATREFTAFWTRAGRVQAAMNVNSWDDGDALQSLVDGQREVTEDELRTADLAELAT